MSEHLDRVLNKYHWSNRPRDSQRAKVHAAEAEFGKLDGQYPPSQWNDARDFYMKVCRSSFIKKMATEQVGPMLAATLYDEGRLKNQCGFSDRFPYAHKTGITQTEILEEVAHMVSDHTAAMHGPEYTSTLLKLIKRFIGPERQREVKRIMLDKKVKTKVVSKETREKQRKSFLDRRYPEAKEELLRSLRE